MFRLVKLVFTGLLSFGGSLATKCMSLNNEPSMVRSTLVDLSPAKLKYFSFLVSLDKCSKSCNSSYDLSTKLYKQKT